MTWTFRMIFGLLVAMVIAKHRFLSIRETFDVDVEPACQHWFNPPSGFWGIRGIKQFNDFYTFSNTVFYSIYRIAMAII